MLKWHEDIGARLFKDTFGVIGGSLLNFNSPDLDVLVHARELQTLTGGTVDAYACRDAETGYVLSWAWALALASQQTDVYLRIVDDLKAVSLKERGIPGVRKFTLTLTGPSVECEKVGGGGRPYRSWRAQSVDLNVWKETKTVVRTDGLEPGLTRECVAEAYRACNSREVHATLESLPAHERDVLAGLKASAPTVKLPFWMACGIVPDEVLRQGSYENYSYEMNKWIAKVPMFESREFKLFRRRGESGYRVLRDLEPGVRDVRAFTASIGGGDR